MGDNGVAAAPAHSPPMSRINLGSTSTHTEDSHRMDPTGEVDASQHPHANADDAPSPSRTRSGRALVSPPGSLAPISPAQLALLHCLQQLCTPVIAQG